MTWFWLALGSAFFVAIADFFIKRYLSDLPLGEVVMVRFAGLVPPCVALWFLVPIPPVDPMFWWVVAAAIPGEIVATFLYMRAITISPLALTQPFLALSPLFALLTGFLFLDEFPSWMGLCGVMVVVLGAYGLNLHQAKAGFWEPFRAIGRERGSWMMLAVSALYAYTAVLGRKAILLSGPWFMAAVYPLLVSVIIAVMLAATRRGTFQWVRRPGPVLAVALAMCGMFVCHYLAISMIQAAYMISVKRLSLLFAIGYGWMFLGEGRLVQHLAAGAVMVAGAGLILLWG